MEHGTRSQVALLLEQVGRWATIRKNLSAEPTATSRGTEVTTSGTAAATYSSRGTEIDDGKNNNNNSEDDDNSPLVHEVARAWYGLEESK